MILATEGSPQYPYNRLMTWIEALITRGFIQEEVVVLCGSSTQVPPVMERAGEGRAQGTAAPCRTDSCLTELSWQASVIISDCDAARLKLLDSTAKPYILVPRTSSYNEHIDDGQIELGSKLASQGLPVAWCPGDLVRFLSSPQRISLPVSTERGELR